MVCIIFGDSYDLILDVVMMYSLVLCVIDVVDVLFCLLYWFYDILFLFWVGGGIFIIVDDIVCWLVVLIEGCLLLEMVLWWMWSVECFVDGCVGLWVGGWVVLCVLFDF